MARDHSDREKAEALAVLKANGGNVSKTARDMGIPRVTLIHWRDGEGVSVGVSEIGQEVEEALDGRLQMLAGTIVGCMENKAAEARFSELAFGLDKAVHAMQLLRNQPTAIAGRSDLTIDDRKQWLASVFGVRPVGEVRELPASPPGHGGRTPGGDSPGAGPN